MTDRWLVRFVYDDKTEEVEMPRELDYSGRCNWLKAHYPDQLVYAERIEWKEGELIMTTYNYKVWFTTGGPSQTMNISRSEPMGVEDIIDFCALDNKTYMTHVELPSREDIEMTVHFGSIVPIDELYRTAGIIDNMKDMMGLTTPLIAFREAIDAKIIDLENEKHGRKECDCHKIQLTHQQIVQIVRLFFDMSGQDLIGLISFINGMCEPNSEMLILNWMHENLYGHDDEQIELWVECVEEILAI